MVQSKVVYAPNEYSLWDLPENLHLREDLSLPTIEGNRCNTLILHSDRLMNSLEAMCSPGLSWAKLYNFLFYDTLGHADYVTILQIC